MQVFQIVIDFASPPKLGAGSRSRTIQSIPSDRLFSWISIGWIRLYGVDDYRSTLQKFLAGKPNWKHSDLFPYRHGQIWMPAPRWTPEPGTRKSARASTSGRTVREPARKGEEKTSEPFEEQSEPVRTEGSPTGESLQNDAGAPASTAGNSSTTSTHDTEHPVACSTTAEVTHGPDTSADPQDAEAGADDQSEADAGSHSNTDTVGHSEADEDDQCEADANDQCDADADDQCETDEDDQCDADADEQSNADADDHSNADADDHSNADADDHSNADADDQSNADADDQSNANADAQSDADADAQSDADADAHSNADADAHSNADADTQSNADADAHSNADAGAHSDADAVPQSNANADAHSNADAVNADASTGDQSDTHAVKRERASASADVDALRAQGGADEAEEPGGSAEDDDASNAGNEQQFELFAIGAGVEPPAELEQTATEPGSDIQLTSGDSTQAATPAETVENTESLEPEPEEKRQPRRLDLRIKAGEEAVMAAKPANRSTLSDTGPLATTELADWRTLVRAEAFFAAVFDGRPIRKNDLAQTDDRGFLQDVGQYRGWLLAPDDSLVEKLRACLEFMCADGLGSQRSSGHGAIASAEILPAEGYERLLPGGRRKVVKHIILSPCCPTTEFIDSIEASPAGSNTFTLSFSGGWVYDEDGGATELRKPITSAFETGSAFSCRPEGRLLEVGSEEYPCYRYGFPFVVST